MWPKRCLKGFRERGSQNWSDFILMFIKLEAKQFSPIPESDLNEGFFFFFLRTSHENN